MRAVLRGLLVVSLGTSTAFVGTNLWSAQASPLVHESFRGSERVNPNNLSPSLHPTRSVNALPPVVSPSLVPVGGALVNDLVVVPIAPSIANAQPEVAAPSASQVVLTTGLSEPPPDVQAPGLPQIEPLADLKPQAALQSDFIAPVATSLHPEVRLVHGSAGQALLEVTPAAAFVPNQAVAPVGSTQTPNSAQERQAAASVNRFTAQQPAVAPAETIGYQGVPAPPVVTLPQNVYSPTGAALSNYVLQAAPTQSAPIAPIAPFLEQQSGAVVYPLPVQVSVTSGFGWRLHPLTGEHRFHAGTDLGAPYGMPVLSALPGQVIAVGNDGGYGLRVLVLSRLSNRTVAVLYAHLSAAAVVQGQMVQPGQTLGLVGSSGAVTGPHLHFELRELSSTGWAAIDSAPLLAAAIAARDRLAWSLLSNPTAPVAAVSGSRVGFPISTAAPTANNALELRVSLVRQSVAVPLASSTPVWVLDRQQRRLGVLPGLQSMVATPAGSGIRLGDYQLPSVFLLEPTAGGLVSVGGKWYRGRLLVVSLPTGLSVINWVPLEAYLPSVVGAEAYPSWGMEALKAQAVAARSYALRFRLQPATAWYDLDDSTRYQAYHGVASEYNTTAAAVAQTAGQIMLDSQGQVLLAEYAATQAITDEAHGGFGMSQWGAAALASQGYGYREILGAYYKQASLTVLASSAR